MRLLYFALVFIVAIACVSGLSVVSQINVTNSFTVLYNEFISSSSTSDFNSMSLNELKNINGMTLENVKGMIKWQENVDLTLVHQNSVVDLDSNVDIGQNENTIAIDNAYFTNLAKTVEISFYGVLLTSPELLLNGELCGSGCSFVSYSDGKYVFTSVLASELNVFELREEPEPPVSGGGGGGGGSVTKEVNFSVEPELLIITLYEGENLPTSLKIVNTGNTALKISFDFSDLSEFVISSPSSFILSTNDEREAIFTFYSLTNGVYTGKIKVLSDKKLNRTIDVLIQVKSRETKYDLSLSLKRDVLRGYSKLDSSLAIVPGSENLESEPLLEYKIVDFEGKEYSLEQDKVLVEETKTVNKIFNLPKVGPGRYVLYASLDKQAISAVPFRVLPSKFWVYMLVLVLLGGLLAVVALYRDSNLFTFRSMMHGGMEALKTGNLRKARDRYNYMNRYYYLLSRRDRKKAMAEGMKYYSEVKKKIKSGE